MHFHGTQFGTCSASNTHMRTYRRTYKHKHRDIYIHTHTHARARARDACMQGVQKHACYSITLINESTTKASNKERSQDPRPKSLQKVQNIRSTMRQEQELLLEFEEVAAGRDSKGSAAKEKIKEKVKEENKLQPMFEIDEVAAGRNSGGSTAAPMLAVKEEVKEKNELQHMLEIEKVVVGRHSEGSTASSSFATAPMRAVKEKKKEERGICAAADVVICCCAISEG